jgi:uncharacterized protein
MDQHLQSLSIWQTLGLHLIPGILITVFYFLSAPLVMSVGYPAEMALFLAILIILIPFELGYLLYQAHKQSDRFSLPSIIVYREPLSFWQYLVAVPILLGWSLAAFVLLPSLDDFFLRTFFAWLPAWSNPATFLASISQYSRSVLLVTFGVGLVLNGIAGPLVEELYFRGYLLPRIPASRVWAPLINVLLFSLYHFFSPWQNVTRIVAVIPLVYAVSWKRNIYLSILTHCLLNTVGMLSMLTLLPQ